MVISDSKELPSFRRCVRRPAHVFRFRVPVEHSSARLESYSPNGGSNTTVVGQHGYVYVDGDTRNVLRIFAEADSIPRRFPIRSAITLLDYDFATVGDRQFLLPLRAEIRLASSELSTRNEVEFREYRKYAAESRVSYGEVK